MLYILFFLLGALSAMTYVIYSNQKISDRFKKNIENKFDDILKKSNKIKFIKRVNDHVYFSCENFELIYQLSDETLYISEKDNYIASTKLITQTLVVKNLLTFVKQKWGTDIHDVIKINENIYSTNLVQKWIDPVFEEVTIKEVELSIDGILDKINLSGYESLSQEEKNYLKNLSK